MSRVQEVHENLFDKIEMPTGDESLFIPRWKSSPVDGYADFRDKGYVGSLDKDQALALGELISKEVFPDRDFRYRIQRLQSAYNLIHSNTKEGEEFRKLNKLYTLHNAEIFKPLGRNINKALIYSDPVVFEVEGGVIYDGKKVESEVNIDDIFNTLARSGLFKESESKPELWRNKNFYSKHLLNNYLSIWSFWDTITGRFGADVDGTLGYGSNCLVALGKTDVKTIIAKRT